MAKTPRALSSGIAGLSNLGLYLAFTSNVGYREIMAGLIVAAVATAAAIIFATAAQVRFEFRRRDVMQAWRLPWAILADSARILPAPVTQMFRGRSTPSTLAALVFEGGDNQRTIDAGHRAIAITYNSAAPNSIVIGIVEDQGLMIYHQLISRPPSPLLKNLGAPS